MWVRIPPNPHKKYIKMKKKIALVAHDGRKTDLIEWVDWNSKLLSKHKLICTGTTGKLVQNKLKERGFDDVNIKLLKSGPLGGDQQLGALIADDKIDLVVFLWDAMTAQPHDVDVKALLRLAVLYNIPMACNRSTADFLITSENFEGDYERYVKNYDEYKNRKI